MTGPTGTGKTELGIILAQNLGGEIVSADSMQVYRGMDIGTAKPDEEEMRGVPHHMLDCADPRERYSVARYVREATDVVEDIIARGKRPIIVGGTGLYIDALVRGLEFAEDSGENALRDEIGAEYDSIGGEEMLRRLRLVDPERAELLAPADRRRIVRALEVFELSGKTITQHDRETRERSPRYRSRTIGLDFESRGDLYARLDARVDKMFGLGLIREVEALLEGGVGWESTAMKAIGYKEIALALIGGITFEEAAERIKRGTRNYAKRQLTWFRRKTDIHWIRWGKYPDFDFARQDSTKYINAPDIE